MSKRLQKISIMVVVLSLMLAPYASFKAVAASSSIVQTVQPKYEDAGSYFGNEKAEVAFVKLGGKWGLINKAGQFIVQPIYDRFKGASSTSKFVQRNNKWGLIGSDGKEIVSPKYDSVGSGFYDELAAVSIGGKWGYIDEKGNEVIPLVYEYVSAFDDGIALAAYDWDQSSEIVAAFIDTTGATVAHMPPNMSYPWDVEGNPVFNEGLLWVESTTYIDPSNSNSNGMQGPGAYTSEGTKIITKTGVVDPKTGEVVLKPEYDNLVTDSSSHYFQDGFAIVAKDGERVIVNKKGTVISDLPQYKDAEDVYETGFNEGLAAIRVDGKWGYIDTRGKEVVAPQYEEALNFTNGLAAINVNNQWGFIDKSGGVIISPQYEEVGYFSPEGLAYVVKDGKYGFINKTGNVVTPIRYDGASNFYDGFAVVVEGKKMGLINTAGQVTIKPQYDSVYTFGGNERSDLYYARQVTDFSKQLFVKGIVAVKIDEKWGFISKSLDVPSDWAKAEVENAISLSLVPAPMQYDYTNNISRADFCNLVVNLLEVKNKKTAATLLSEKGKSLVTDAFSDTSDPVILMAYSLGIVGGKGDGIFDPEGEITRQEAAVMLSRTSVLLGITAGDSVGNFADSNEIASWASSSIAFISSVKDKSNQSPIMGSTGNNNFSPKSSYTKQQAFITVKRLFNAI